MKTLLPYQQTILDQVKNQIETKSCMRWGYMLEPGLGKTKLAIETANLLQDIITRIIIIIPSGLKATWQQEIKNESHWNENQYLFLTYSMFSTNKLSLKRHPIIHGSLLIIDESHFLKNPKSKRTKLFLKLLKDRDDLYILSLTGTPNPKNILDLWIQCKIVKGWLGGQVLTYWNFMNMYGEWEYLSQYRKLTGEKNRILLLQGLKHNCFFLKKENVLNLPDKIYETRYYDLSKEQKKLIKTLKKEAISQIDPSLDYITATIHNYLMICSGFTSSKYDNEGERYNVKIFTDLKKNPKLELLKTFIESNEEKCIIYCAYRHEIEVINGLLIDLKKEFRYRHGNLGLDWNQQALDDFRNDKTVDYLVATVQSTSIGLNITEAHIVVYFNNTYDLMHRIQSEDRIHRIGQKQSCTYIDLIGVEAPDEKLLNALKVKSINMQNLFNDFIKEK